MKKGAREVNQTNLEIWDPETTAKKIGGFSEGTLANWRSRGEGPPFLKIGGRIFYEPEAVRDRVQAHRRSSTMEPLGGA